MMGITETIKVAKLTAAENWMDGTALADLQPPKIFELNNATMDILLLTNNVRMATQVVVTDEIQIVTLKLAGPELTMLRWLQASALQSEAMDL
jgi:hypothetical protein